MAIAELFRTQTKEREEGLAYAAPLSDAEMHNARIGENYAKLIHSHSVEEVLNTTIVQPVIAEPKTVEPVVQTQQFQEIQFAAPVTPIAQAPVIEPRFAQSARISSELFRADSVYNKSQIAPAQTATVQDMQSIVEEESEDLRPTATTIQYKSGIMSVEESESEIANTSKRAHSLSKKDKIVIAVVASIIIALFVLIIVNSAIITSINREMSNLEGELSRVTETAETLDGEMAEYQDNLREIVDDFAQQNGMVRS